MAEGANEEGGPVKAPFPPLKEDLEARLSALEAAFHASLSHLGTQHPTVVQWLQGIRDRISAALGGAKSAAPASAPKEE